MNDMPPKHAEIRVAHLEGMVCIRIKGRATVHSSVPFKRFMLEQLDLGHRSFVIELSQCLVMDSTFLGVLASLAAQLQEADAASAHLELVHANERVLGLIDNLGVLDWFEIRQASHEADASLRTHETPLAMEEGSRQEMAKTSLKAHRTLMALHPSNQEKFKDVTAYLEKELGSSSLSE